MSNKCKLQQLRDPLVILHVRLPSRHLLHMPGIHQQDREPPFQNVIDRLPVNSRRVHRYVGHSFSSQPLAHRPQLPGHRRPTSCLLPQLPISFHPPKVRFHGFLMHIQSCTTPVHRLHRFLHPAPVNLSSFSLCPACSPPKRRLQSNVRNRFRPDCIAGFPRHRDSASNRPRFPYLTPLAHFHPLQVPHSVMTDCVVFSLSSHPLKSHRNMFD